jgi:alpha-N-arabinofuranosidase
MLPVTWRDGWPQILPSGKVIPTVHRGPDLPLQPPSPIPTNGAFNVADYFNERALPRYWMMLRTPHQSWYKLHRGVLVLAPRSASIGGRGNPSLLARRQQNANSSATTQLRFTPMHEGERAGLVAFQNDAFWYFVGLERTNGRAVIVLDRRAGPDEPRDGTRVASAPFTGRNGAPIFLKIAARGASYDFYYGYKRERWQPLKVGEDGTVLSTKRAGGFVGAMFGLYAYDSTAKEGK